MAHVRMRSEVPDRMNYCSQCIKAFLFQAIVQWEPLVVLIEIPVTISGEGSGCQTHDHPYAPLNLLRID